MTHIKKSEIVNIKSIDYQSIYLNGHTIIVTGRNNSGKTTVLKTMIDRLRSIKPPMIKKDEEKSSSALLEFMDGAKFTWQITEDGSESLFYTDSDGKRVSSFREIAKKYLGEPFDIDQFVVMSIREQVNTLKNIFKINTKELDDKETFLLNDGKSLKKRLIDVSQLSPVDNSLPSSPSDSLIISKDIINYNNSINTYNSIINTVEDYQNRVKTLEIELNKLKSKVSDEQSKLSKYPVGYKTDLIEKIDDENKKLEDVNKTNALISSNNARKQKVADAHKQKLELSEIKESILKIRAERENILSKSNLPSFLSIKNEKILIDGLPLDKSQLSTSKIYIASIMISKAIMGDMKSIYFDASSLDLITLQQIIDWAEKEDIQLLIEKPSESESIVYEFTNKTKEHKDAY